ncbi:inhibitor of nuclear factor kappa-B kinase-interacting protein [Latimeria chalumnae]|uniref:inhibitor of nuclear factor kappa-B kinase-interacting protein n=1 Tax=Latimeria chalumnae TaxID=7897 RepID=UPI0006D9256F|nr:PREDICTED: inhibitor of nuclear factor kappa-B kinase-interacting protein-like [Latimeria chalumnae]|eukprot:XP_014341202.1 PREDICTED: inhibitor of nuclear factor kappa-B kinase-interacting protein-like [Latimeria chalumnae]
MTAAEFAETSDTSIKAEWRCESAQEILDQLKDHATVSQIQSLEAEIQKMKKWSKSITAERNEQEVNMTVLSDTIQKLEESTALITKVIYSKISTVKTDIRRISGLESDVTALSESLQEVENKVQKAEKTTVQKMGDLLALSIERATQLKSSTSRNSDRIDALKNRLAEFKTDSDKHSDRLLDLESGRAKLLKTVTFANDLKPKIHVIRKDIALLEPRMSDLTLRIGRLASDMLKREEEIALLKEKMNNLTMIRREIKGINDQMNQTPEIHELLSEKSQPHG